MFVGLGWLTLVVVFVLFAKSDLCTIFLDNFLKPIVFLHNIAYNKTKVICANSKFELIPWERLRELRV